MNKTMLLLLMMLGACAPCLVASTAKAAAQPVSKDAWIAPFESAIALDAEVSGYSPWGTIDAKKEKEKADKIAALKMAFAEALERGEGNEQAMRALFTAKVRERRSQEFSALMKDGIPKDAASAMKLSAQIVDFVALWNPLFSHDASVDNQVLSAVLPFLPMTTSADFTGRPAPFKDFANMEDKAAFKASLERVAAFIPEVVEKGKSRESRSAGALKPSYAGATPLIDQALEGDVMAIRLCVNAVIDDMQKTYGGIEPTASFRKSIVKDYSQATTLGATGPWATLFAVLSSLVLFGGLALALFKAASGKGSKETEATSA